MTRENAESFGTSALGPGIGPGQLAEIACLLEVTARKPGNVHRFADLGDLHFLDFLLSATAMAEPLEKAFAQGVGRAVHDAIESTRRLVRTNTNLGIVLLLAPMAAVPDGADLASGVEAVLSATTIEDARLVYEAIRLAQPGGLGEVNEQDIAGEPTMSLRDVMALAAERDLIARQYANGFREVLHEALPELRRLLQAGRTLESTIVAVYLNVLARHPDSLIARTPAWSRPLKSRAGRPRCSKRAGPCAMRLRRDLRISTAGSGIRRTDSTPARRPTW